MENNKKVTITYSWPVATMVFLAFFFAKIFGKIDWSWWWVFSPLWIPLAIVGGIVAIAGIVYLGVIIINATWKL